MDWVAIHQLNQQKPANWKKSHNGPGHKKLGPSKASSKKTNMIFEKCLFKHMGVSENRGTPKSSILIGFSIIFTIHFGVPPFLETPTYLFKDLGSNILRHLQYPMVFHIFAGMAILSTMAFQILASETTKLESSNTNPTGACTKACSAVRQWKDPKTWLLGFGKLIFFLGGLGGKLQRVEVSGDGFTRGWPWLCFFCLMYLTRKELQKVFAFFLSLQSLYTYLHDWNSWDSDMKVNAAVARRKCLSDATHARNPRYSIYFF